MTDMIDDVELEDDFGIDLWAVSVVVREQNRWVKLNVRERQLACHLFKIKGVDSITAGDILGVSNDLVLKNQKRACPIDLDTLDLSIIGNRVPKRVTITRDSMRHGDNGQCLSVG